MKHDQLTEEVINVLRSQVFGTTPVLRHTADPVPVEPVRTSTTTSHQSSSGDLWLVGVLVVLLLFGGCWYAANEYDRSRRQQLAAEVERIGAEVTGRLKSTRQPRPIQVYGHGVEANVDVVRSALTFVRSVSERDYALVLEQIRSVHFLDHNARYMVLALPGKVVAGEAWTRLHLDSHEIRILGAHLVFMARVQSGTDMNVARDAVYRDYHWYVPFHEGNLLADVRFTPKDGYLTYLVYDNGACNP